MPRERERKEKKPRVGRGTAAVRFRESEKKEKKPWDGEILAAGVGCGKWERRRTGGDLRVRPVFGEKCSVHP